MSRESRILGHLSTAVLTCDSRLQIGLVNAAAENLLGVSAHKAIGRPFAAFVATADIIAALEGAHASGQPVMLREIDMRLASHPATLTVDCVVTPIAKRGARDRLLVELITIDRRMRLAREGARSSRFNVSQAILRGLAHEIRNPLGGLRGAAQLLDRELGTRELREYTRIIIHEADRLRNLVDRMMGPSTPPTRAPVNVHEVLEHIRKLLSTETTATGVVIERDYDPSLPAISGDREQLIQAVLNIARNALEAMPDGGVLRFRTRIERQVTVGLARHRHALRIDIEDNGHGIPESLREEIFYPMVSGRPEGTGLGLSIANEIIAAHDGIIECVSEPGLTRFSLLLPAREERA